MTIGFAVSSTKTSAANHNVVFSGKAREEEKRSEGARTQTRERERERERCRQRRGLKHRVIQDADMLQLMPCARVAVLAFCCPLVAMEDHDLLSHTNRP
jgi:hypothetical protein